MVWSQATSPSGMSAERYQTAQGLHRLIWRLVLASAPARRSSCCLIPSASFSETRCQGDLGLQPPQLLLRFSRTMPPRVSKPVHWASYLVACLYDEGGHRTSSEDAGCHCLQSAPERAPVASSINEHA